MILQKLADARALIKASTLKKGGHNDYSNYDYFTPEQINKLVHEAEKETGLIHVFNLVREANGLTGYLVVTEIETGETVSFTQATDIPSLKATNIAQQIGGAVTYTNRYMLMTAFDIVDNSLDFDAKDNRASQPEKEPAKKPAPPPPPAGRHIGDTPPIPETAKFPIPEKAWNTLCERLKANPEPKERGNLLAKTRRYYLPLTEEQEMIISEILDN